MHPQRPALSLLVLALVSGCARNTGALLVAGAEPDERIAGLYPCGPGTHDVYSLDPHKPLTLLVHGCNSSGARFKLLSQVFEAQGQQTLCFNYNDRDYLNTSATQLASALGALQERLSPGELTLIGHSQGGLVARRALQADLPRPLERKPGFNFRLVTVSAPFDGIQSSADCGKVWLHVVSLSTTVLVCLLVTGNKWPEIPPGSAFLRNPAPLVADRHLQIITDERGTCRVHRADGTCATDDFVFSLEEQRSPVVGEQNLEVVTLEAGHAAVVGETGEPPTLLMDALRQHGVLAEAPGLSAERLATLYAR